jgi:uncharacterized protein (TIGR02145 family)/uncharacterized repeat protein (TIGR02543 family)
MGSGNVTLYAKWVINKYTVKFNSKGGSAVDSQKVDYATLATAPTAPTKTSYVFAGWYSDSALTTAFQFSTPIFANKTLYAKWEIRDADGNVYTEVTIGTQVWMVENLKTTKYNDGTGIPLMSPDSIFWTPGYCWYNDSISYKTPYGALYNGYAVTSGKLAPSGWHVATNNEWAILISYLGNDSTAGGPLKETGTSHWNTPNTGATNTSGFTALGGGYRIYYAIFESFGVWGYFWTSTQYDPVNQTNAYYVENNSTHIYPWVEKNNSGLSVRCIRD